MDQAQTELIVMEIPVDVLSLYLCGCNRRNGGDVL
jgi:hypothetical protein